VGTITGGLSINCVPDQAAIGIDIRTIPGMTNSGVCQELESYLGEEVKIESVIDVGSVASDPQNEWVQEVFSILEPYLAEKPVPRSATYFTDASVLTPALGNPPTTILGPGEPALAHKTNEFCYIDKIEEATEVYGEIAKRWCEL